MLRTEPLAHADRSGSASTKAARVRVGSGVATAIALTSVVAFVYWPGLGADWIRDDYLILAFVRLVGSPWALFVTDHFHAPGSHFRPLGYATQWLTQALFGNSYRAHAIVEGMIHVGVVLSLYRLMRVAVPVGLAIVCTLLYAIHPAVISTALWYSDRYGHLAALFTLIAVRAAHDNEAGSSRSLLILVPAALAAMLSKEIGVIVVVPITAVWVLGTSAQRARMWLGLAWVWGVALIYFVWRWAVLGTPGSQVTGAMGLMPSLVKGVWAWLANLPGYLGFWPRLDSIQRWVLGAGITLSLVVIGVGLRHSPAAPWRARHGELLVSGVVLALLPGLLQAPIAALNARPLTQDISAVEVAMQARLYYLSFAGVALVVSVLAAVAWAGFRSRERRATLLLVMGSCAVMLASVAWQTVDAYRARSVAMGQLARVSVAALGNRALPADNCNVYFLGIHPPPEWDIYVAMDSVVKALSPDLDKVARCLIHADYETFIYLLPAGEAAHRVRGPRQPRQAATGPLLPRRVADVEMVYVEPPTIVSPDDALDAAVLSYEGGRFVDIGDDVASGRRDAVLRRQN